MDNTPTVAEITAALRTPGQRLLAPYRKPGASYAKLSPTKLDALEAAIDAEISAGITEEQLAEKVRIRRLHFEADDDSPEWKLELQAESDWLREWLSHTMIQLLGDAPNYLVWTVGFGIGAPQKVAGKSFDIWIQRPAGEPLAAQQHRLRSENERLQVEVATLRAELATTAAREREACLAAALNEPLCEPNPDSVTDEAYDRGVQDAAEAIIARREERP